MASADYQSIMDALKTIYSSQVYTTASNTVFIHPGQWTTYSQLMVIQQWRDELKAKPRVERKRIWRAIHQMRKASGCTADEAYRLLFPASR